MRGGTDFNGEEIANAPRFDIAGHFNLSKPFAAIDASVFKDDDGALYLTFAKHEDSSGRNRGIWGMKLLDPVTPDFSTLTCLTMAGYKSVKNFVPGVLTDDTFPAGGEAFTADSVLNEGNFLLKKNGKYYLTYSTHGYADKSYCVMRRLPILLWARTRNSIPAKGNPLVSAMASGIGYMAGTGHHSVAAAGDELFSVYAYHGNPENTATPTCVFSASTELKLRKSTENRRLCATDLRLRRNISRKRFPATKIWQKKRKSR